MDRKEYRKRTKAILNSIIIGMTFADGCRAAGVKIHLAHEWLRRDLVFKAAYTDALEMRKALAENVMREHALNGVEEDIWYRGFVVGKRRNYDHTLLVKVWEYDREKLEKLRNAPKSTRRKAVTTQDLSALTLDELNVLYQTLLEQSGNDTETQ